MPNLPTPEELDRLAASTSPGASTGLPSPEELDRLAQESSPLIPEPTPKKEQPLLDTPYIQKRLAALKGVDMNREMSIFDVLTGNFPGIKELNAVGEQEQQDRFKSALGGIGGDIGTAIAEEGSLLLANKFAGPALKALPPRIRYPVMGLGVAGISALAHFGSEKIQGKLTGEERDNEQLTYESLAAGGLNLAVPVVLKGVAKAPGYIGGKYAKQVAKGNVPFYLQEVFGDAKQAGEAIVNLGRKAFKVVLNSNAGALEFLGKWLDPDEAIGRSLGVRPEEFLKKGTRVLDEAGNEIVDKEIINTVPVRLNRMREYFQKNNKPFTGKKNFDELSRNLEKVTAQTGKQLGEDVPALTKHFGDDARINVEDWNTDAIAEKFFPPEQLPDVGSSLRKEFTQDLNAVKDIALENETVLLPVLKKIQAADPITGEMKTQLVMSGIKQKAVTARKTLSATLNKKYKEIYNSVHPGGATKLSESELVQGVNSIIDQSPEALKVLGEGGAELLQAERKMLSDIGTMAAKNGVPLDRVWKSKIFAQQAASYRAKMTDLTVRMGFDRSYAQFLSEIFDSTTERLGKEALTRGDVVGFELADGITKKMQLYGDAASSASAADRAHALLQSGSKGGTSASLGITLTGKPFLRGAERLGGGGPSTWRLYWSNIGNSMRGGADTIKESGKLLNGAGEFTRNVTDVMVNRQYFSGSGKVASKETVAFLANTIIDAAAYQQFGTSLIEDADSQGLPPESLVENPEVQAFYQQTTPQIEEALKPLSDALSFGDEDDVGRELGNVGKLFPEVFSDPKTGLFGESMVNGKIKLYDPQDQARYAKKIESDKDMDWEQKGEVLDELWYTSTAILKKTVMKK